MRSRYMLASLLGAGFALVLSLPSPADETPSKEKIDKLIEQMGSGTFAEREKATKELSAIGVPALEALRKATKSEDAEVRKRAEDLLPKIERQAESIRILAPKRVHLVYKDTPLSEAVADFQTKSGYALHLHDPEGKLKERKLTLDTGATTFWHALGMFCDKAELTEGTMQDLMEMPGPGQPIPLPAPNAPAMKPAILRPGRIGGVAMMPGMPGAMGQIILKDGKSKSLPTDDGSAVRVRAIGKSEMFGTPGEGEVILALEVSPEPKLQWQALQSIRLDTAEDDRDQKLTQVIPQVEGAGGFGIGGGPGIARPLPGPAFPPGMAPPMIGPGFPMPGMMWGGISQQVPLQLKKGAKEAKSLKELKGVITAQLLTEPQPMIVADKLKVGETFKGKEGGFIKIVEVKAEDEKTTIRLEFEQPPFEKVVPAQPNGIQGFGGGAMPMPIRRIVPARKVAPAPAAPPAGLAAPPPAAPLPPPVQVAPPQAQIVIQGGNIVFGGNMPATESFNGLTIQNDKGKALPIQMGQTQGRFQQMPGGGFVQTMTYTFICPHDKDKGKPAKVVFLGRKRATVDIPFALKDVALPK